MIIDLKANTEYYNRNMCKMPFFERATIHLVNLFIISLINHTVSSIHRLNGLKISIEYNLCELCISISALPAIEKLNSIFALLD